MTDQAAITKTILAQYADGPALLDSALSGLRETDLDLALSADSWSIRQIVHHIADGDDLWKTCIKAALGNSDGIFTLQWYWEKPQMEWSENWAYNSRSLDSSLALLRANRYHIAELIERISGSYEKSIQLLRRDQSKVQITVFDVVEMQSGHLMDHIKDIRGIRQAHGV